MRTYAFALVVALLFLIYGLLNYYIGVRSWHFFGKHLSFLTSKAYWTIFWAVAFSYFIGRLGDTILPMKVAHSLKHMGSYWLGVMFYLLLIIAFLDVARIAILGLERVFDVTLFSIPSFTMGVIVLMTVVGLVSYGSWNAQNPRWTTYDIAIEKPVEPTSINAVLVSDIHLGTIIDHRRLSDMVAAVNAVNPDIVFLVGDIIDEDVDTFVEQGMVEIFQKLETKLGAYAVLGNHEYIGGKPEKAIQYLEEAGITVLRDEVLYIKEGFYIIGRDDRTAERFGRPPRTPLAELTDGIDWEKPVILLDHQPNDLGEARVIGIDLQLSGHTHRGQLFPNHLITQKMFEVDWGYKYRDKFHIVVSNGYGTWGPPIRVGNRPELVQLQITFR